MVLHEFMNRLPCLSVAWNILPHPRNCQSALCMAEESIREAEFYLGSAPDRLNGVVEHAPKHLLVERAAAWAEKAKRVEGAAEPQDREGRGKGSSLAPFAARGGDWDAAARHGGSSDGGSSRPSSLFMSSSPLGADATAGEESREGTGAAATGMVVCPPPLSLSLSPSMSAARAEEEGGQAAAVAAAATLETVGAGVVAEIGAGGDTSSGMASSARAAVEMTSTAASKAAEEPRLGESMLPRTVVREEANTAGALGLLELSETGVVSGAGADGWAGAAKEGPAPEEFGMSLLEMGDEESRDDPPGAETVGWVLWRGAEAGAGAGTCRRHKSELELNAKGMGTEMKKTKVREAGEDKGPGAMEGLMEVKRASEESGTALPGVVGTVGVKGSGDAVVGDRERASKVVGMSSGAGEEGMAAGGLVCATVGVIPPTKHGKLSYFCPDSRSSSTEDSPSHVLDKSSWGDWEKGFHSVGTSGTSPSVSLSVEQTTASREATEAMGLTAAGEAAAAVGDKVVVAAAVAAEADPLIVPLPPLPPPPPFPSFPGTQEHHKEGKRAAREQHCARKARKGAKRRGTGRDRHLEIPPTNIARGMVQASSGVGSGGNGDINSKNVMSISLEEWVKSRPGTSSMVEGRAQERPGAIAGVRLCGTSVMGTGADAGRVVCDSGGRGGSETMGSGGADRRRGEGWGWDSASGPREDRVSPAVKDLKEVSNSSGQEICSKVGGQGDGGGGLGAGGPPGGLTEGWAGHAPTCARGGRSDGVPAWSPTPCVRWVRPTAGNTGWHGGKGNELGGPEAVGRGGAGRTGGEGRGCDNVSGLGQRTVGNSSGQEICSKVGGQGDGRGVLGASGLPGGLAEGWASHTPTCVPGGHGGGVPAWSSSTFARWGTPAGSRTGCQGGKGNELGGSEAVGRGGAGRT
ncbi:unnamed protein product, partial [Discosporangium mesarthrocarpum]